MLRGVSSFLVVDFDELLLCATLFHDENVISVFSAVPFNVSRNFAFKLLSLLLRLSVIPSSLSLITNYATCSMYVNLDRTDRILGPSEHSEATGTSAFLWTDE
jgi:hypothetical protein